MAEADGQFEVGSRVWLMLPGRDRANAVVKWTAGDKLGAEFAEPISLDGLEARLTTAAQLPCRLDLTSPSTFAQADPR